MATQSGFADTVAFGEKGQAQPAPKKKKNRNVVTVDTDSMAHRNRASRVTVFLLTFGAILALTSALGLYLGSEFSFDGSGFLLTSFGFATGVYICMQIFPSFWVVVPQTAAYVTTDLLTRSKTDPNIPYGPGAHIAFPWESREESGNITLDIFTIPFEETVPTGNTAVIVKGMVQFKFSLHHVNKVIGIDASTIDGFMSQINEYVSHEISQLPSGEEALKDTTGLRKRLEDEFEGNSEAAASLLDEYGIFVTGFQVSSIDFPKEVQEARDARMKGRELNAGVLETLGYDTREALLEAIRKKEISWEIFDRANDRFLAMSGTAKLDVKRIDITGLDGAKEGGAILAGLVATQGRDK